MKRAAPVLALLLLAPWVGEFLLGNISVRQLPGLLILTLLYGCGALLIREVTLQDRPRLAHNPAARCGVWGDRSRHRRPVDVQPILRRLGLPGGDADAGARDQCLARLDLRYRPQRVEHRGTHRACRTAVP